MLDPINLNILGSHNEFFLIKHVNINANTFTAITRYIANCYTWEN